LISFASDLSYSEFTALSFESDIVVTLFLLTLDLLSPKTFLIVSNCLDENDLAIKLYSYKLS